MKTLFLSALCFTLIVIQPAYSQCSDAGICIIGKKHKAESKEIMSTVSLGYRFGTSGKEPDINGVANDLTFNSAILDVDLALSPRASLRLNIPFTVIEGPSGSNSGLGDLTVLYAHHFKIKQKHNLVFSIGGKVSIADVNTRDSLPQRYMTGLGTNDLMTGLTYSFNNYSLSAAYQMTFGRSANVITRLKRGDDFLFSAGYNQQFGKLGIKAGILTIIRIQRSSIRSLASVPPEEGFVYIQGSNEPQVNLMASFSYIISDNLVLSGEAAIPFLNRDFNYDGLKRTFTAGMTINYLFKL